MVTSRLLFAVFVGVLVCERLFELVLSRRNAAWALAQGGVEAGQSHFRWMKLLHTAFFFACLLEVYLLGRVFVPLLGGLMLAVALAAQGLRYWAIAALGRRWNVRVIVLPNASPVTSGPYRFVRHPNYLAVALEIAAVPLIHGAWLTALVFSLANGVMLLVRIRCEEAALSRHSDYQQQFGHHGRFFPKRQRADALSSTQVEP